MKEEGLVKNLEDFLTFIRDESSECSLKEIAVEGFLHSVHVIGFHHKQGSIVEFSYPDNSKNELLAYLALPDCVHNTNTETFFFTLPSEGSLKHCVSCFCQVPNLYVTQQMNRNFVQKAVVVVSHQPYYGIIAKRLENLTQVYFDQKNFSYTQILVDGFHKMQKDFKEMTLEDLYFGLNTRMLVKNYKEKLMNLLKLVILQGRVIVFSKTPSHVSGFIYALLSLLPGQLNFGKFQFCPDFHNYLKQFGLPLSILSPDFPFHSYFSIFQLAELEKPGYLIGCTNQMIVEHPRSSPHAVVHLDTNKMKFHLPSKLKDCIKSSPSEAKLIKDLFKAVETSWTKAETWTSPDCNNSSHLAIISHFHKFFQSSLANLALLRLKLQGNPVESLLKLPKATVSGEYSKMNSKVKKTKKFKKFLKSGLKNKFLYRWANFNSFRIWLKQHPSTLGYFSEYCGEVQGVEVRYEKGEVYRGGLLKGKRHGKGIFLCDEYKYEGDWLDDKVISRQKSGAGIMTALKEKYVYDGSWVNDLQEGQGCEVREGCSYNGSFFNGKYHGNGMIAYNDSSQYNGEWVLGRKQGMGRWTNKDGDAFKGEFFNDLFHGQGQLSLENGDIYSGVFVNGKIHGKGECLLANGEFFEGEFFDGVKNSKGSFDVEGGGKGEGDFVNGDIKKQA